MRKFFDFIERYKEYFAFTALIVISLSLISVGDISKMGGFRSFVIGSVGRLQEFSSFMPYNALLVSENRSMRELNLENSFEITKMRRALIENNKLRDLMTLKDHRDYLYISADVVGKSAIGLINFNTLNRGKLDSIKVGMAVRNDLGLIGRIVGVSDNYSLVELIVNKDIKIAAKIQDSRIDGVLEWVGGRKFKLKNIPKSYGVQIGDTVLTSSYSNKYPAELPIGIVRAAFEKPGDIFQRVEVEPFAEFANLELVFIIYFISNPEREAVVNEMDEKLRIRQSKARRRR
ncbi:MAG: rod shape-determining protein MreC [Chlorobi bacterium]|nr:rod shape-determining protein MreC [Chlorobiota bacterium]